MSDVSLGTLHEILIRVEKKVDKTNGRVTKLEAWKNKTLGALVIINVMLIPLVAKWFWEFVR